MPILKSFIYVECAIIVINKIYAPLYPVSWMEVGEIMTYMTKQTFYEMQSVSDEMCELLCL